MKKLRYQSTEINLILVYLIGNLPLNWTYDKFHIKGNTLLNDIFFNLNIKMYH